MTIRYSPKPIEAYSRALAGAGIGPSYSTFLGKDIEAWNLAWLSHDYAESPEHSDPKFTVLVHKTVNLARDGLDVRRLLTLPAPVFWGRMVEAGALPMTPLYAAYGRAWVDLVFERAVWEPTEAHLANPSQGDGVQLQRALENMRNGPT